MLWLPMTKQAQEKQAAVAVWSVDGIGVVTYRKIAVFLAHNALSWSDFWLQFARIIPQLHINENIAESCKKFKNEHSYAEYSELLQEKQIEPIMEDDLRYPPLLCELGVRPPVLFARGSVPVTIRCPVAVVGTRRMTSYGQMATDKITSELVAGGATIVSGFMYGVDTQAHKTALAAGGSTVGILGFGFDTLYPRSNQRLFQEMLAHGGWFFTEYAPHVVPKPGNFLARNRLVAGMSLGVVVVEAGVRSGTHSTASFAGDEGRDVFAVPGPITNPYSEGTKALITEGAQLITSGWEVLDEVGFSAGCSNVQPAETSVSSPTPLAAQVFAYLKQEPATASRLATRLGVAVSEVQEVVTLLELQGAVIRRGSQLIAQYKICQT